MNAIEVAILIVYFVGGVGLVLIGRYTGQFRGMREGEAVVLTALGFMLWPPILIGLSIAATWDAFTKWLTR